ncbi:putative PTH11-type G-protein coupled receptor protein [Thozetella sp. PMI_491]|nr:putative PTH11-type G-protein coupled receptor protein [Thozetella sp. PMI_491]
MRSQSHFFLALLGFAPLVLAANSTSSSALSTLPECAQKCLAAAIANSTCSANDSKCTCTSTSIQDQSSLCIIGSCTVKEALYTKNTTSTACGAPVRNKTQLFNYVTIILGIISAVVVALRVASKYFMGLEFFLDDWCILFTLIEGIPSSVMNVIGTAGNGEGRDIWTLSFDMITNFGYYFYVLEILYFSQVALLKLTLLLFYLRIFPGPVKKLLWATVIFDVMFGITFMFVSAFQCRPVSYFWLGWDGEHQGSCLNVNAIGWANACISIALDVWMLVIPLWQIRSLKLHWKKKVGVAMMFFVGTFITVVSIIRLQYIVDLGSSTNPTFDQADVSIWSTVEINVGIICTCMPTLRLFLVRLFPVLGGTTHNRSNYQNYGKDSGTKSKLSRSRSRTLIETGNPPIQPKHAGIELYKMHEVQYGEEDEASLVRTQDTERSGGDISRSGIRMGTVSP